MRSKLLSGSALIVVTIGLSGCQTWPGGTFPMQGATRVPPPGTGTYPLPNGYYNNTNTSAVAPTNQTMQASNSGSGLRTPSGAFPTTNLASSQPASTMEFSSSDRGFTSESGVSFAAHPQSSSVPSSVVTASGTQAGPTSQRFSGSSDSPATHNETPSLRWQQEN